ncbi:MAG: hypothetical protein KAT28_02705 [Candidatus Aenigmarchaeota archaeon]|nr:hypothetical protein [Candidatus Aenigmarchaeota archaeon]
MVNRKEIVDLISGQYPNLTVGDEYPTTLKTDYMELKLLPKLSIIQDFKDTFKSTSKKSVEDYEVNGIRIDGLSLDEKEIYPVNMYSIIPVNDKFNMNILIFAIDSMTDIQRYLKDYKPKIE